MAHARGYELVSGVATGLLGLIIPWSLMRKHDDPLLTFLLFVLPALLVAVGAYLDAVRRNLRGRLLLWSLIAYYVFTHTIFFLLAGKFGTVRGALPIFALPVMAAITLALSLSNRQRKRLA